MLRFGLVGPSSLRFFLVEFDCVCTGFCIESVASSLAGFCWLSRCYLSRMVSFEAADFVELFFSSSKFVVV